MSRYVAGAVFLLAFGALLFVVHRWIWLRLIHDPAWPAPWAVAGRIAIFVAAAGMLLGLAASRLVGGSLGQALGPPAFIWMGLLFLLLLTLGGGELVRLAHGAWARLFSGEDGAVDPEQRVLLARALGGGAILSAAALGATALRNAAEPPAVVRVDVPIANLPAALDGFRVVQISDLHVSAMIRRPEVERIVALANAQQADLVALTGDMMDGSVAALRDDMAPIADLLSRHGTFFVTGNHEYYSGADEWLAELRRLGVRPLRNERVRVEHDGAALELLGIDDWSAGRFGGDHGPDLPRAASGRDPALPSVLLAHQPRAVDEAADFGLDLVLSGHTHGGQLWPFGMLVRLVQPYVAGLHLHRGRTRIYVSRGTGSWGPPMRLLARHELTVLTLRSAA